jgi:hypothetical protein
VVQKLKPAATVVPKIPVQAPFETFFIQGWARRRRPDEMRTTIDSYKQRAGRLDLTGVDFGSFAGQPLSCEVLRCLQYMHDVELHTVCYLRDLLLTPAHRDPDVTSFLACWVYEELWHGEAIGRVLEAHGIPAGSPRIAALRARRRWRDAKEIVTHVLSSALAGRSFVALHMAWGAINEWSTQAGYAQLARRSDHPVLKELLGRIMRQEGRHADFYASEAGRRLSGDRRARVVTRLALQRLWRPVGAGLMPDGELSFLVRYLFSDQQGRSAATRIDRHVDRLPGLSGLTLVTSAVDQLAGKSSGPWRTPRAQPPTPPQRAGTNTTTAHAPGSSIAA